VSEFTGDGVDTLEFGAGIAPTDVTVRQLGGIGVVLSINGTSDQVTLDWQLHDGVEAVDKVRFVDGTVWSKADLFARSMVPTTGDDQIDGDAADNIIDGGAGDDVLNGNGGSDTLIGGSGNDMLFGDSGDTVVFSGNRLDYRVIDAGGGIYVVEDQRPGSPDGFDTVIGSPHFQFADFTLTTAEVLNVAPTDITMSGGSVAENAVAGTVVATLSAVDSNAFDTADRFTYVITGGASDKFAIDGDHVVVKSGAVIDHEAAASQQITVSAIDGGGAVFAKALTIAVTNVNEAPVATIADHSLHHGESAQVKTWLTQSDPDGDTITQYQFRDDGTGANSAYVSTSANAHHAAGAPITVAAADLDSVQVHGGQAAGTDAMSVRSFDGSLWSEWDQFNVTTLPNTGPVATIGDHTLGHNEWVQVKTWLATSDADGDAITQYQFWDGGTTAGSAYFWTPANPHNDANVAITVAASDLDNVWLQGGRSGGTEPMWVRAFDGTTWGAWAQFNVTTRPDTAPVATIDDHAVHHDEWVQVKNWLAKSDADGDAITQYQFWDGGSAADSGYFWTSDNPHNAANTAITVAAADLDNVWLQGGHGGGSEQMWVRAFDGTTWGDWDLFNFTTLPNSAPATTIADHSLHTNEWAQVKPWLSVTDADNDAATEYQFWDGGGAANSAYFWTPANPHNDANAPITVAAADLANVWIQGGQAAGSEQMWVRAYDGTAWSDWTQFHLTTIV